MWIFRSCFLTLNGRRFSDCMSVWLHRVVIIWLGTLQRAGIKWCSIKVGWIELKQQMLSSCIKRSEFLWLDILSPFFETAQYFVFPLEIYRPPCIILDFLNSLGQGQVCCSSLNLLWYSRDSQYGGEVKSLYIGASLHGFKFPLCPLWII